MIRLLKSINKIDPKTVRRDTILLISFDYICYQAKDEVYLIHKESLSEKDGVYKGLDNFFI